MDLDQVLEEMKVSETQTKVASSEPAPASNPEEKPDALMDALSKTAKVDEPPAESPDVVDDLMKMASELAGTEKEAEVAHAALLGQAFADAAISKFAAYDAQAAAVAAEQTPPEPPKVAAAAPEVPAPEAAPEPPAPEETPEPSLKQAAAAGYEDALALIQAQQAEAAPAAPEKVAEAPQEPAAPADPAQPDIAEFLKSASDEEVAQAAAQAGYSDTVAKLANEYQAGHDQAMQEVHDVAAGEFLKGAAEAEHIVNVARQQQAQAPAAE